MESLFELLHYRFFEYALVAALLASISCGLIGTYIVTRRMVFMSGSISHASFGGIGLGYLLGFNPLLGATFFSVFSALGIQYFSRSAGIRSDTAIGIFWSIGMALGIIFVSLAPGYAPNLMTYLFGSILTITVGDILFLGIVTLVLLAVFIFLYRLILYISFDEEFSQSNLALTGAMNYLLISLAALTIVACVRIAGIILVISLLTIPQTIANLLTRNYKRMIVLSVFFSLITVVLGLLISYWFNIPSGATIIFVMVLAYLIMRFGKTLSIKLRVKNMVIQES
jgi:zinc transport system permease protein